MGRGPPRASPRKAERPLASDWRCPQPIVGEAELLEAVGGAYRMVPPLGHCPIAYGRALAGRRSGDPTRKLAVVKCGGGGGRCYSSVA